MIFEILLKYRAYYGMLAWYIQNKKEISQQKLIQLLKIKYFIIKYLISILTANLLYLIDDL